jgi:transposase
MIPSGVQIFVALEPINMRLSFDRLAGIALEHTGYDVRGGSLFLFFGKRGDALKILFADTSGMCLFISDLTVEPSHSRRARSRSKTRRDR